MNKRDTKAFCKMLKRRGDIHVMASNRGMGAIYLFIGRI